MKRRALTVLIVALLLAAAASVVWADKPVAFDSQGNETGWSNSTCRKIQSGEILDSASNPITVGYDQFGYNYQAHLFHGRYCDNDRVLGGASCDVDLMMKWNDAWLSNVDCDEDYSLDRHYPHLSYVGSGAWLTNHMWGSWEENGTTCEWDYFVKIVAKPHEAYQCEGEEIWDSFCVIQRVYNSPCEGVEGIEELFTPAGFGTYK